MPLRKKQHPKYLKKKTDKEKKSLKAIINATKKKTNSSRTLSFTTGC